MPPKKKARDARGAKKLKQIKLFESPKSSPPIKRQTRRTVNQHPSASTSKKPEPLFYDSSSDEIGDIHFVPKTPEVVSLSDSDENIPVSPKSTRKRRLTRRSSPSGSDQEPDSSPITKKADKGDDSDDSPPRKRGRLLRRRPSPSTADAADSDEHIADIANEVDEERILEDRLRRRNKKSAFQKNLEKLKRRKMKGVRGKDTSEEEDEDEDEDASNNKPFKGAEPSKGLDEEDSEGEGSSSSRSSDFIVEDDGPVHLPAQFSMETHQDLSHQFKKIFQFFVHIAVEPPEDRATFMHQQIMNEEYFSVPLQVTRRKLLGLRDSLVASSVWKPEFRKSLERYPEFDLVALDFAVPSCDACHLGGRLSTRLGRLSGSPYNRFGFEELPTEDSEDEKEFNLGRFCGKRTKVYHEFCHWEHSLFQVIRREIDEARDSSSSTGFLRVAYFGGKKPPENLEDADALCDWLDERKIIEMEWHKLKTMMESAHHLELHAKKGDDEG
ncbi:hypothetical protein NLJ89_g1006 [Agrocybe chaxingu]|uniref:DUF4211 domain-containing protein n=1 Tax=Agrocybe chaxingu TaxID=84603 RepID=A0A9W8TF50_9AGAR|nr:hypothetical protein NLJ89_g1006 [Agrocybe chaxingu]